MDHTGGIVRLWKEGRGTFGAVEARSEALLLLGGNLGDPPRTLDRARQALSGHGRVVAVSRDHWTLPWGFTHPSLFLNRALVLATDLSPAALLQSCLRIEEELGRVRDPEAGMAAREVDIDLLLVGEQVINAPGLVLPHPRMHQRAFALAPAADVAPLWRHPVLDRTVLELLDDLRR